MKTLIPILISLVLCGCDKSVVSVTRPSIRGDLNIVEYEGHRFAIYNVYDAAGICEVTDASRVHNEAAVGDIPMFRISNTANYYEVSNSWYRSGIESHLEGNTVYFKPAK